MSRDRLFAAVVLTSALAERGDIAAGDVHLLLADRSDRGDNAVDVSLRVAERLGAGWSVGDIAHEMRVLSGR